MSEEKNDAETFNEVALGGEMPPVDTLEVLKRAARSPTSATDDTTVMAGKLVQYGQNAHSLVPTTSTFKTLPAGCYAIDYVNHLWSFVPHDFVTDKLLRLPDSKSDFIISEIERFWGLKSAYDELGYSHKRGVLLFGPAGSGKTTTIAIVSQQMIANGDVVFFADSTDPQYVSQMLHSFRQVEPDRRALVVIEDIDAYIKTYGEQVVLSLLDGEQSISNVCYVATTNYPENLDGRVINRPSRFDRVVKVSEPNAAARRMYLESRKLGLSDEELSRWVDLTPKFSIAHLKELVVGVIILGGDLEDEVKRLSSMFRTPKSDDTGNRMGFGGEQ